MSIESIQKDLAAKIDSLKCQTLRFTNDGGFAMNLEIPDSEDVKKTFRVLLTTIEERDMEIGKLQQHMTSMQFNVAQDKETVALLTSRLQESEDQISFLKSDATRIEVEVGELKLEPQRLLMSRGATPDLVRRSKTHESGVFLSSPGLAEMDVLFAPAVSLAETEAIEILPPEEAVGSFVPISKPEAQESVRKMSSVSSPSTEKIQSEEFVSLKVFNETIDSLRQVYDDKLKEMTVVLNQNLNATVLTLIQELDERHKAGYSNLKAELDLLRIERDLSNFPAGLTAAESFEEEVHDGHDDILVELPLSMKAETTSSFSSQRMSQPPDSLPPMDFLMEEPRDTVNCNTPVIEKSSPVNEISVDAPQLLQQPILAPEPLLKNVEDAASPGVPNISGLVHEAVVLVPPIAPAVALFSNKSEQEKNVTLEKEPTAATPERSEVAPTPSNDTKILTSRPQPPLHSAAYFTAQLRGLLSTLSALELQVNNFASKNHSSSAFHLSSELPASASGINLLKVYHEASQELNGLHLLLSQVCSLRDNSLNFFTCLRASKLARELLTKEDFLRDKINTLQKKVGDLVEAGDLSVQSILNTLPRPTISDVTESKTPRNTQEQSKPAMKSEVPYMDMILALEHRLFDVERKRSLEDCITSSRPEECIIHQVNEQKEPNAEVHFSSPLQTWFAMKPFAKQLIEEEIQAFKLSGFSVARTESGEDPHLSLKHEMEALKMSINRMKMQKRKSDARMLLPDVDEVGKPKETQTFYPSPVLKVATKFVPEQPNAPAAVSPKAKLSSMLVAEVIGSAPDLDSSHRVEQELGRLSGQVRDVQTETRLNERMAQQLLAAVEDINRDRHVTIVKVDEALSKLSRLRKDFNEAVHRHEKEIRNLLQNSQEAAKQSSLRDDSFVEMPNGDALTLASTQSLLCLSCGVPRKMRLEVERLSSPSFPHLTRFHSPARPVSVEGRSSSLEIDAEEAAVSSVVRPTYLAALSSRTSGKVLSAQPSRGEIDFNDKVRMKRGKL